MENTKTEIIYYGILVYLVSLIVILVPTGYDPGEFWWHLKAGEWTVHHGFMTSDPFSHTTSGSWLNYNWLTEVLFYYAFTHVGVNGIYLIAFFGVGGIICALVFATCLQRSRCLASTILITLLVSQCVYMIALKPHIISYLFTAWFMYVVNRYLQNRSTRLLWTLPALQAVWANVHVMFVFGWLASLILLAKAVENKRGIKRACLALALMLAAPLINPYGYKIYPELVSLFQYGFETLPKIVKLIHIPEFMPPGSSWGGYTIYVVVALLALIINRKNVSVVDACVFVLMFFLSMSQAKYVPYFAIVTAGIVAGNMPEAFTSRFSSHRALSMKTACVVLACVAVVLAYRLTAFLKHSPDMATSPVQEVAALKAAGSPPRTGNMLNILDDGQYLLYELHPEYRTFIDARLHLFSKEVVGDYLKVVRGHQDGIRIIEKYNIDTVVLPKDFALIAALKDKGWQVVHDGKRRTVLQIHQIQH